MDDIDRAIEITCCFDFTVRSLCVALSIQLLLVAFLNFGDSNLVLSMSNLLFGFVVTLGRHRVKSEVQLDQLIFT
jgi:hypothetical protein